MRRISPKAFGNLVIFLLTFGLGLFLLLYGVWGLNHAAEIETFSYTGSFRGYEIKTHGKSSTRYFYINDEEFRMDSVRLPAFDSAFLSEVRPEETVWAEYQHSSWPWAKNTKWLCGLRTAHAVYMTPDATAKAIQKNHELSVMTGFLFILIACVFMLAAVPRFKQRFIYLRSRKRKRYRGRYQSKR
jgi:hypothetical protein